MLPLHIVSLLLSVGDERRRHGGVWVFFWLVAVCLVQTSHAHAAHKLLKSVPASAFRAPSDVIKIPADASFVDALKTLHDNKVSGAPVYADEITAVRGPVQP